jgi:phage shock protein PspC (stress-responsive transcriptional regulator)
VATGATAGVAAGLAGLLDAPPGVVVDRLAPVLWLALIALAVGLVLIAVPAWLIQRVTAEHLRRP